MESHPILLFDGVCNLCTWSVQFIIERDRHDLFRFASLQSTVGQEHARRCNVDMDALDTFLLVENGRCYTRSEAALRVARRLPGAWRLLGLLRVIPRPMRDPLYNLLARNRYRLFGRRDTCMLPTPELRERFLENE